MPEKKTDARCREECPLRMDIAAFSRLAEQGRWLDALRIITERDPLPHITGALCAAPCADADIRALELAAADAALDGLVSDIRIPERGPKRVAVVGAGAAGLAAAAFLARGGCRVTVFERRQAAGGSVRYAVVDGRIDRRAIDRDAALVRAWGVHFCFGCEVCSAEELAGFDRVVLCTGAGVTETPDIEGARSAAEFLAAAQSDPKSAAPGKSVAVIGGGRLAAAAALTARHMRGVKRVTVVYPGELAGMGADERLVRGLMDGVRVRTLLAPLEWKDGSLLCEVMALGAAGAGGVRPAMATGDYVSVAADRVLAAMEERPDTALYRAFGVGIDGEGRPVFDPETGLTDAENVYLAGSGSSGDGGVASAIAGAARAARAICGIDFEKYAPLNAGWENGGAPRA